MVSPKVLQLRDGRRLIVKENPGDALHERALVHYRAQIKSGEESVMKSLKLLRAEVERVLDSGTVGDEQLHGLTTALVRVTDDIAYLRRARKNERLVS